MKINAVGVFTSNLSKAVEFYSLLGFKFPEFKPDEQHLEAATAPGETRLMLDSKDLAKTLISEEPRPGNGSVFAVEFANPAELDEVAKRVSEAGFKIFKEPWDAFWGQRYAVVEDLDGHRVDLFATISK